MPSGRLITYKGETLQIGQWAKRCNISPQTLAERIYKNKWSLKIAFTKSPTPQNKTLNYSDGIELYQYTMRRFLTKQQRLESYKRLILEMKEQRMKKAA